MSIEGTESSIVFMELFSISTFVGFTKIESDLLSATRYILSRVGFSIVICFVIFENCFVLILIIWGSILTSVRFLFIMNLPFVDVSNSLSDILIVNSCIPIWFSRGMNFIRPAAVISNRSESYVLPIN